MKAAHWQGAKGFNTTDVPLEFCLLQGEMAFEFSWQGSDEGYDVSGRGWAALNPDGRLEGHIYFHLGDDSAFRAERFNGVAQ